MVVFLVATSLILSAVVVPNLLTQGRREREEEMVWRGEQYERAIGMYYRKFGRYPTKVDDLIKQTNGVRFLRQAYTDPMNKDDGSWRFIYVGPNGQLVGSVKSQSLLQNALASAAGPGSSAFSLGAGASPFGQLGQQPAAPSTPIMGAIGGPSGAQTSPVSGQQPGQQTVQGTGQQTAQGIGQLTDQSSGTGTGTDSLQSAQPQPLSGTVLGGNIIGVGSKIKESSLMIYLGGDNYNKWEFIWNPMQQGMITGQQAPVNPNAQPAPGQVAPGQLTPPQNQPPAGVQPQQQSPNLPTNQGPG
jgi:type II secretory pathway pseudopilin PulG